MIETENVVPQKVHVGLALVIYTDRPDLWKDKENLAVSLKERQNEIEMFRTHGYGRPSEEGAEFKVEFEPSDCEKQT